MKQIYNPPKRIGWNESGALRLEARFEIFKERAFSLSNQSKCIFVKFIEAQK